jgi:hypothetical protein
MPERWRNAGGAGSVPFAHRLAWSRRSGMDPRVSATAFGPLRPRMTKEREGVPPKFRRTATADASSSSDGPSLRLRRPWNGGADPSPLANDSGNVPSRRDEGGLCGRAERREIDFLRR